MSQTILGFKSSDQGDKILFNLRLPDCSTVFHNIAHIWAYKCS